nr:gamma-glutamyl-gamma-aminobutyrate hydrolase family protein [Bacteroidota bacterium]
MHNQQIDLPAGTKVKGLILSGGRGNPYAPLNLSANFVALNNYNVPTLGFCLSHEILAVFYGGCFEKLPEYHKKKEVISIIKPDDKIFSGIKKKEVNLQKLHSFHVSVLPPSFERLAYSETSPNEIIRHRKKPIYGFQSHPEVSGQDGMIIMMNFLRMCKLIK